jgi:succinoglycan biosynthesis protein ExoA
VYNEYAFIRDCLNSLLNCGWSFSDSEIIIADGMSDDGTREILDDFCVKYPYIKVLDNERRQQVYALNDMVLVARGDCIIRCDAHSIYPPGYLSKIHEKLSSSDGLINVGVPVVAVAPDESLVARAIAIVLSSRFGVGISHRTNMPEEGVEVAVDTVLFGAWHRSTFEKVGFFNEDYIRGQDYEHNLRIRKMGGDIVQVGHAPISYYTRTSYFKLLKMMMQYSSVKPKLFFDYGVIPNIRSFVPFAFYAVVASLLFLAPYLAVSLVCFYLIVALVSAVFEVSSRDESIGLVPYIFSGFLVQHFGHAFGVIAGISFLLRGVKSVNWTSSK